MDREYQTPLYNREDSIAQGLVVSEIEKQLSNRIAASYFMSDENFENKKEIMETLILIGGSVNNSISRELLKKDVCEGLNFNFDLTKSNRNLTYTDKNGINQIKEPKAKENDIFMDYALILNIRNPWCTSKRLIAIMGCNGLGTYGAAKYIHSGKYLENRIKDIIEFDEYAILISCKGLWKEEKLHLPNDQIFLEDIIKLQTTSKV